MKPPSQRQRPHPSAILLGVLLAWFGILAGCDRDEIVAYRVPKESVAAQVSARPVAESPTPQSVVWTAPAGWTPDPEPRQFRVATYTTQEGVEVAVSALGGRAGGIVPNINRWRGQLGLPPIDASEVEGDLVAVTGSDPLVRVLDIQNDQRAVVAIVEPGDGQTWFVKATDDIARLDGVKGELIEFARSIRLGSDDESAPRPTRQTPHEDAHARASWTVPASWHADSEASSMTAGAWHTASGCRVSITPMRGDGGGELVVINVWRNQLGLEPVDRVEAVELQSIEDVARAVDLQSTDGDRRLVAGIVRVPGGVWYVKLLGTSSAVEQELEPFRALVAAVAKGQR